MKRIFGIVTAFMLMFSTAIGAFAEPPEYTEPFTIRFRNGNICYVTPPERENAVNLKTGVYANTTPPTLLYEFPYNYFSHTMYYFTNDGLNHAEYDAFGDTDDTYDKDVLGSYSVIKFYEKGKIIKKYSIPELLKEVKSGDFTSEGFQWSSDYYQSGKVNYVSNILYVVTKEDIRIVFDMKTGKIISKEPLDSISAPKISVGSKVAILGYAYYKKGADGFEYASSIPYKVKCVPHVVSQISGDYALLGSPNGINSWVAVRDLIEA